MIRIAIVEDDKNYAEVLKKYLLRYEKESDRRFLVDWFQDGKDITKEYNGAYDIILMDIEMKYMDGMKAAEEIRKQDISVVIIFITNTPQYAMKGYAVEALDYVIKPINYYAFSQRIDRALKRMTHRPQKLINITYKGRMKKIEVSDILYVEVRDHELNFHTTEGEFLQRGTMKEIEEILSGETFFRCNKSYLINLEYVGSFDGDSITVGSDALQVSRSRKKELLDAINQYMNEVSK